MFDNKVAVVTGGVRGIGKAIADSFRDAGAQVRVIDLRGRKSLLAVHCHSRYAFVRYDVAPLQWADMPALFRAGLADSLTAAGFAPAQTAAYLERAGDAVLTRTHGRREVAFLNRAWEDVLALDLCVDPSRQAQPLLDRAVNTRPSRCAGLPGLGAGLERIADSLRGGPAPARGLPCHNHTKETI